MVRGIDVPRYAQCIHPGLRFNPLIQGAVQVVADVAQVIVEDGPQGWPGRCEHGLTVGVDPGRPERKLWATSLIWMRVRDGRVEVPWSLERERVSRSHIVNICFHGIGAPRRDLEPGEEPYLISVDAYHRVLDAIAGRRDVRISFNDGNSSDVEHGLPGLLDRGLMATFFVIAGRLGTPGSIDEQSVRELGAAGMAVGTHGMDHCSWRGMDGPTATRELVEARDRLASVTGTAVDEAAMPRGRYDRRALGQLRRAGYRHVYSSDRAPASAHAWLQPRFSVRAWDTAESIRRQVLAPPSLPRRAERGAVGLVKRLR